MPLDKKYDVMESLTKFCKDQNIDNGKISGIGAIKEIELGAYDLSNKEYITQSFEEVWELTSFQGNIQLKEGNPFIHAHININNSIEKSPMDITRTTSPYFSPNNAFY